MEQLLTEQALEILMKKMFKGYSWFANAYLKKKNRFEDVYVKFVL